MVFQLTDKLAFPDPHYGDPDGLLAVGGDLSIDRLILAYSNGIFPWYAFREELIQWWCPMDRFVIFPDEIHISHSMRTLINKGKYEITFNEAFQDIIQTCGELRIEQEGAWLGTKMMEAYTHLHEQGFAASVEVWEEEQLVGGLYGMGRNPDAGRKKYALERVSAVLPGSKPQNRTQRSVPLRQR